MLTGELAASKAHPSHNAKIGVKFTDFISWLPWQAGEWMPAVAARQSTSEIRESS